MASRSFKPTSYLTAQSGPRSPRPSFTRSSSASSIKSTKSTKSDDSFVAGLRSLSAADRPLAGEGEAPGGASPCGRSPATSPSAPGRATNDSPSRKRSDPIPIIPRELQSRKTPLYTPLTARGDLPGGYFPYHETFSSPLSMSTATMFSPVDTRRGPPTLIPTFADPFPSPEHLTMPKGKYYPANYKSPVKAAPISARTPPPTNIYLPPSVPDRKKRRPGHESQGSDVKRKLQEYQMAQARNAQRLAKLHSGSKLPGSLPEPDSPRLTPMGSPGPITPFELEESLEAGYVVAGANRGLRANTGLIGHGLGRDGDRELVGRMIREEEKRRIPSVKEGTQSPPLRV